MGKENCQSSETAKRHTYSQPISSALRIHYIYSLKQMIC